MLSMNILGNFLLSIPDLTNTAHRFQGNACSTQYSTQEGKLDVPGSQLTGTQEFKLTLIVLEGLAWPPAGGPRVHAWSLP